MLQCTYCEVKWRKWASGDGAWVEQGILGYLGMSKTGCLLPGGRDLVVRESQGNEVT